MPGTDERIYPRKRSSGPYPRINPLADLDPLACTHHRIQICAEFNRGDVSRRRRDDDAATCATLPYKEIYACVESLRRMRGTGSDGSIR